MKSLFKILLVSLVTTSAFSEIATPFKSLHANGNLKEIGFYHKKTHQKHGQWTYYFENGKIKQSAGYIDGKNEGEWKYFFENGGLWKTNYYKDGRPVRKWKEYLKSGKLIRIGSYKSGKRSGKWKKYWSNNGKLQKTGSFKLGKREGEWKHYFNNGNLKQTVHYKNGNIIKTETPK